MISTIHNMNSSYPMPSQNHFFPATKAKTPSKKVPVKKVPTMTRLM